MALINKADLVKRIHAASLQPLLESARFAQLRLTKKIYNNRHIRDIKRFLREQQEILKKSLEQPRDQKRVVTETSQKKGIYDENELKQLCYQFESVKAKYIVTIDPSTTSQNSDTQTRKRADNMKKKLNDLSNDGLKRKFSIAHSGMSPFNRMKSISLSSKRQINESLSPLKFRNRVTNPKTEATQLKIVLRQGQIGAALNHLTMLTQSLPQSHSISKQKIFSLIQTHFHLKPYAFHPQAQPSSLQLAPQFAQLPQTSFHLQLPYCDFINMKESRRSIERIFNMSIKTAQRVAFHIYDRNGNGVIDEKDIIQLFTVAEGFASMREDLEVIVKHCKVNGKDDGVGDSPRNRRKFTKRLNTLNSLADQSEFSLDKLSKINVIEQEKQMENPTSAFRKSKFFTFKQTKQQFFKKKLSTTSLVSLTWSNFQQAFQSKRPRVFYDVLDYLFNIDSEEIYERALREKQEQDKKLFKIMIFNNSDGKSEKGSVSNSKADEQQSRNGQPGQKIGSLKLSVSLRKSKISKQSKRDEEQKLVSVDRLLDRVKLIEPISSIKYG